jgi:hypothetical protein
VRDVFRSTIQPDSLRPALARMKSKGLIDRDEATDKWSLTRAGRRFDHPSNWRDDD